MPEESAGNTAPTAAVTGPGAPKKWGWSKIAAIVLVVVLIVVGVALIFRPQNHAPVVVQTTVSLATAKVEDLLTFKAQVTDPDSDILSYSWDFGDGTSASGEQVDHRYGLPGHFIALVTVTDGKGGTGTNDGNLLFIQVDPSVTPPSDCPTAPCPPGPVVAVLTADRATAAPSTPIVFNGNASWAYAFSWNNTANHNEGGTYTVVTAADNASLFGVFKYVWGDGSDNKTGTSETVGHFVHAFGTPGNFFVRLTVTYDNYELIPPTRTGSAGYTVRVAASPSAMSEARLIAANGADGWLSTDGFLAPGAGPPVADLRKR